MFKQSEEGTKSFKTPLSVPELSSKIMKEIRSYWTFPNAQLQQEIEALDPEKLTALVHDIIGKINLAEVDKLASKIPLGKLEQAVRLEYPQQTSA